MNIEGIQNNEYIRTKNGNIAKVINNQYYMLFYIETDTGTYLREQIVNHSKNIIDLIKVGDYVNGKRVFATDNRINDNGEKVILTENYDEWTDDGVVSNKDIKTIVTNEQYKSVEYVF